MSAGLAGLVSLLRRNRACRLLMLADITTRTGDSLSFVTIVVTALSIGSPDSVAYLMAIYWGAPGLVSPLIGTWVDRLPRRWLMITADLLRIAGLAGLIYAVDRQSLTALYVFAFVVYGLGAAFEPARRALIQTLVPEAELAHVNSIEPLALATGQAVGAIAAGALLSAVGPVWVFVLDGLTFLMSAVLIVMIGREPARDRSPPADAGWMPVVRLLAGAPRLRTTMLIKPVFVMIMVPSWTTILYFGQSVFPIGRDGALSTGLMQGTTCAGAFLGVIAIGRYFTGSTFRVYRNTVRAYFLRALLQALFVLAAFLVFVPVVGFALGLLVSLVASAILNLCGPPIWIASNLLVARLAPEAVHGRLFSMDFAAYSLLAGASGVAFGLAIHAWDLTPWQMALLPSVGCVAAGLFFLRQLRHWGPEDRGLDG